MRKMSGNRFLIGITVILLLTAAIWICVTVGIFSGRPISPQSESSVHRQEDAEGICFENDDELRGRMTRVIMRRGAEAPNPEDPQDAYLQKLYDGTLLCFAEAARAVWPELDTGMLSERLLFEDDAEKNAFIKLVERLISGVRIDKPEDITYWINKETLAELLRQKGQ